MHVGVSGSSAKSSLDKSSTVVEGRGDVEHSASPLGDVSVMVVADSQAVSRPSGRDLNHATNRVVVDRQKVLMSTIQNGFGSVQTIVFKRENRLTVHL